jgi:hypothetical protein
MLIFHLECMTPRRYRIKMRSVRLVALAALLAWSHPAGAQQSTTLHAAPSGTINPECTVAQPCTVQTAVERCAERAPQVCHVMLANGVYPDPAVNIYYYRFVNLIGDCAGPQNVVLRATQANSTLVWVQDHAIAAVRCLTLDATAPHVLGIAGRQHVIVDYDTLMFGPLGTAISMTEFSIASCLGNNWITGSATAHVHASSLSKINLNCSVNIALPNLGVGYFVLASDFSIVSAQGATFSGESLTGTRCTSANSLVYRNGPFPGDAAGNC